MFRKSTDFAGLLAILALVMGAALTPSGAVADPSVGACPAFPPFDGTQTDPSAADLSAWNQNVTEAPRDPRSRKYMRRIRKLGGNQALHPDFGGGGEYGIPFEVVPEGEPLVDVVVPDDGYQDESDFGDGTEGALTAPIPLDAPIEGGSGSDGDRHVLVVREGTCDLWEMYRAFPHPAQDRWVADATALFDLFAPTLRPDGWTSADAAGLPILPGLVRPDEVAAESVDHAIRVTFQRTRRAYIHPATHYASSRCGRTLPPMGLRLRMKEGYFDSHLADFEPESQARPIFEALRSYGMIVADNGSNFYLTGAASPEWDDDDLGALKDVPGRAFEVVDSEAPVKTPC